MPWTHDKNEQTENLTGFEHAMKKICKMKTNFKMGTAS